MNSYLNNPVALFVLLCGIMTFAIAVFAWHRHTKIGAKPFAIFMLLTSVYVLGYSGELISSDLESMLFWSRIQYIGILFFPTTFLIFAMQYSGNNWINKRRIPLLYVIPALLLAAKFYDSRLHLFYAIAEVDYNGTIPLLGFKKGPLYLVAVAYNLTTVTIGNYLFIRKRVFSSSLYNSQSTVIIIAAMFIYAVYIIYLLGIIPFPAMKHLDYNPLAYSLWGAAIFWAIFKYRMFDLVPIARDALIEIMSDAVIVMDEQRRLVDANPAAKKLLNLERQDIGMDVREISLNGKMLLPLSFDANNQQNMEIEIQLADAMTCYLVRTAEININSIQKAGYLIQIHDISERKNYEKELQELSLVDELTGLNNRRGFNMLSSQLINMANRMQLSAVIFYLDMDKLKQINDNLGHAAGDKALKTFAEILKQTFRSTDVISRIGGDEFVIFALESHGHTKEVMLGRLQQLIAEHNHQPDTHFTLSCSAGTAYYEHDSNLSIEQLLEEADKSMYAEKSLKG